MLLGFLVGVVGGCLAPWLLTLHASVYSKKAVLGQQELSIA